MVVLLALLGVVTTPNDRIGAGQRSHPGAEESHTQKEDYVKGWHSANASGSHTAQKVARFVRKNE